MPILVAFNVSVFSLSLSVQFRARMKADGWSFVCLQCVTLRAVGFLLWFGLRALSLSLARARSDFPFFFFVFRSLGAQCRETGVVKVAPGSEPHRAQLETSAMVEMPRQPHEDDEESKLWRALQSQKPQV